MDDYPPYRITDAILTLVAAIAKKTQRIADARLMANKPHLRHNNRIRSIQSSLAIEANSLSLDQVHDVIDGRPVFGPQKEILEVKNAHEAYERLPTINPYRVEELLILHGIMTKGLILDAGSFRLGEEGVFSDGRCIFMAPPARLVPKLVRDLFNWMEKAKKKVHPLLLSSVFHYEFVFIHPFSDGNGRIARLWQTALLMDWDVLFQYLPIENQIHRFQNEYYQAISDSHVAGESTPFITFMLQMIDQVLSEMILTSESNPNPCIERLLEVMEYGTAYTAQELLGLLGLKSRLGLRKNYLAPALAQNLISMTEPDKPTSKKQRYRKR